ncbi:MAG TPA: type II CAAX endopeptidase family protein [Anaerolineales bacterium]|nr:type II CAAX endopeptidase family protein [Anaerolineales bacterium]
MDTTISPRKNPPFASIFLSPDENRLRAGWRLLLFIVLFIVISKISRIPISFLPQTLLDGDKTILILIEQFLSLVAITLSVFIARQFLDKRPFVSLGVERNTQTYKDILAGIVIAFLMFSFIFIIELSLGWLKVDGFAWQEISAGTVAIQIVLWFAIFVIVGWQEELQTRGYLLQNLADGINLFWAVAISSVLFGLMHLGNPGANWVSTLGILLAGLFLTMPYILTRQLWISIGLHIGWNFSEGVIYGLPVSGIDTFHIINTSVSGSDLLTGGAFGPEAGLVLIPALALGAFLVWRYVKFNRTSLEV